MAKILFSCDEVNLPHAEMVELRKSGHLELGIDDRLLMEIASKINVGLKKSSVAIAFHFWNWVAVGGLIYTIYLSFTVNWWWFILGFIGMSVIWKVNKELNSQNYLEVAMVDEEFYERIREFGGWIYKIEESVVDKYKR